jgi:hypothetical protein
MARSELTRSRGGGPLMRRQARTRRGLALIMAAAVSLSATMLLSAAAPAARAGTIAIASCKTPAGAPAPTEGWQEGWSGSPMPFAGDANQCATGGALSSVVYDTEPQPASSGPTWRYTPPAGYTLTGGEVSAFFSVPGGGQGFGGAAALLGPQFGFDTADVIGGLPGGTVATRQATYPLAGHTGGSLWVYAFCEPPDDTCPADDSFQAYWALAEVRSAILELSETTVPQATGFGGSLLEGDAHGTANLDFTASEAAPGPGIYQASVQIDGQTLYQGTPDGNEGRCAPVGRTASGVMEFLSATPCPLAEQVDLPIDTTALADGQHELKVSLADAAGTSETVYDAKISTSNRTSVSALLDSPRSGALAGEAPRYAIVLSKRTAKLGGRIVRSFEHSALRLKGRLRSSSAGVPAPGVTVTLSQRAGNHPSGPARVLARTTTNAAGRWRLHATSGPSRALRISYGKHTGQSITITEIVRPSLSLHVASPGGGRIVFAGRLRIRPLGSPRPLVTIQTRAPRSGWETVGVPVRVQRNGDYRYTFTSSPLTYGRRFTFRAVTPSTSLWRSARSPVRKAVVH